MATCYITRHSKKNPHFLRAIFVLLNVISCIQVIFMHYRMSGMFLVLSLFYLLYHGPYFVRVYTKNL